MLRSGKMFLGVMVAVGIAGCATGPAGISDEEAIAALAGQWSTALIAHDVDAFMALHSENFAGDDGSTKADYRDFIVDAIDQGMFDSLEVYLDEATLTIEDDTATYNDIGLSSELGSISVDLRLAREDGVWAIVSLIAG